MKKTDAKKQAAKMQRYQLSQRCPHTGARSLCRKGCMYFQKSFIVEKESSMADKKDYSVIGAHCGMSY